MVDSKVLAKEIKYLDLVKETIQKIIKEHNIVINKDSSNAVEMKKFIWQNSTDYNDLELQSEMNLIDEDVENINVKIKLVDAYTRSLNNPYFAKIEFTDNTYHEKLNIYIGMKSVVQNHEFLVFDWRAPISSLFYNYELGNASYDSPSGEIKGEILSKMQFKIEKGNMVRCFSSDINIDDDFLQEILASSSSDKMKNIVSTIQREQNEIIRNTRDNYLVVQGAAGSGKTSVALHRIAYLLYQNINLVSNNILIFSPNDIFSDYISNVLPELGEDNVLTTTFSDFSKSILKNCNNIENYTQFLERVYSSKRSEIYDDVKYKMSDAYIDDLMDYMNMVISKINFQGDILVNNIIISKLELKELFLEKFQKLPILERLDAIAEYLSDRLKFGHKKNKLIIKRQLLKSINLEFDIVKVYKLFLETNNLNFNNKKINYEDVTPLLYLYFYYNGIPSYSNIKQIVIDEAQDYTYSQISILKKIFSNAKFTILGDVNQTINPFYKYESMNDLAPVFKEIRYLELNKTYRSSEEIINYTNNILGISNTCSARREMNIPVDIENVNDISKIGEYITELLNKKMHKIAIITKNKNQAKKIFSILNDERIQLIDSSECNIDSEIVIIPSYLSKGLEFDSVIAYCDDDGSYDLNETNLYYVVCTRAQHALKICNEPQKILKKFK